MALAESNGTPGFLDSVPAIVPVHGVVTANDGRKVAMACLVKLLFKLFQVTLTTLWWGITAIHEGMDADLDMVLLRQFDQSIEVGVVRVNAAIGKKPHQVEFASLAADVL